MRVVENHNILASGWGFPMSRVEVNKLMTTSHITVAYFLLCPVSDLGNNHVAYH